MRLFGRKSGKCSFHRGKAEALTFVTFGIEEGKKPYEVCALLLLPSILLLLLHSARQGLFLEGSYSVVIQHQERPIRT
jgi:hypothetical protein